MADPIALPGAPLLLRQSTLQSPNESVVPAEIRRAAHEFEEVFLSEMLAPMFDGLQTDGLGGGGMGEEIFRPMLIERYAEAITRSGGVGIADSVIREMMRLQQVNQPEETTDGAQG
ncbi:MAG: rod-binding protein [Hyphomonadaceae bacterium]